MDDIHLGVERFLIFVLLDISKAFESMSYDLLLHKLRFKFGLSRTACRFFCSPRTQKVMINGECSDFVDIDIGSTHGSVLSPF
jgi:hypothetical protein